MTESSDCLCSCDWAPHLWYFGSKHWRKYRLASKVTATVTDNRSNFVKAFVTFATGGSDEASSHDNEEDGDVIDVTFTNLHDLMGQDSGDNDLTQIDDELPPHQCCTAHTLNLVASKDVDKHLSSCSLSRSVYRSAFAKCVALQSKANRSTLAADKVEESWRRNFLFLHQQDGTRTLMQSVGWWKTH